MLVGCRMAIGVFEAPSYPCNNKIVTSWFPNHERATAISIYTSGQYLGLAVLSYGLVAIQDSFGWRGLFFITGAIGIVWAVVMYAFYRDPREHPTVNREEIEYIREGGGYPDGLRKISPTGQRQKFNWAELAEAFRHRKLWGVYIGQYCLGAVFWFFLTWFPTYIRESRGITGLTSGFLGSIPYLGAFVGVLLSGFVSDYLLKRGHTASIARKIPVLCGLALSSIIVCANFTTSTSLILTFMTLAAFGSGLASIAWIFISALAPPNMIGTVGGVFNFIGNLSGATFPLIIAWLARDGNFSPAFVFIGVVSLLGFCSYLFLVGRVERIEPGSPH
jgi:ACS family D-galactonate transporter-like MFS transporter